MQIQIIKDILSQSKQNLLNDTLFKDLNIENNGTFFSEHGIWGQINYKAEAVILKKREIQISNLFFNEQFNQVKEILNSNGVETVVPLKGISLINSLYSDWQQRKMSDIDIYVPPANKIKLHELLTNNSYEVLDEVKWSANQHKVTYIKKNNFIDITIEVHFKLYYHTDYKPKIETINQCSYLSKSDELLYLCYHLAEQHNFLKLFWLKDIALFIERYEDEINWENFHRLSKKIDISRSTNTCLYLCNQFLGTSSYYKKTNPFITKWITWEHLCYPRKSSIRYFLLKHYLKGKRSPSYLFNWLKIQKN